MTTVLSWWQPSPAFAGSAEAVHRTLLADEDVDGLVDLPIRQMIDSVKQQFPKSQELAGGLKWNRGDEAIDWTWSFQTMRASATNLSDESRVAMIEIAHRFGCTVYDARLNLALPPP